MELADLGLNLPQRLRRLPIQLDRGELTVTSRLEMPEATARRFEQAANCVSVSILAAAAVIGLSVLASTLGSSAGAFGSFLLKTTLAAGLAHCAWLIAAFWRSGR